MCTVGVLCCFFRRSVTLLNFDAAGVIALKVRQRGQRVDVMHYHVNAEGKWNGKWEDADTMYRQILQASKQAEQGRFRTR